MWNRLWKPLWQSTRRRATGGGDRRASWRDHVYTVLMSVFLALIVWVFAIYQENPPVRRQIEGIPIEIRGLEEGLQTLQDLSKRTVTVTIRAPQRVVETLQADDFQAFIDLTGRGPGTHDVAVQVQSLIPDVEILDVQPRQLRVQIERVVSKSVPVRVDIMDLPATGYDWQTPLVEPMTVTVRGPETLVADVRAAVAEVYLRGAKTQVEITRPLQARNAQEQPVERVTLEPAIARIVVPITQLPGRKEVAVLVQIEGQPAPGYRIASVKTEPSTVVLTGRPDVLRNVPGYVETPPLSIDGATSEIRQRLPLLLPEGVSVTGDPSVLVTVLIEPIQSSLTVKARPTVQGLGPDMKATVSLEQVDVILSGSLPRLEELSPDDVQVILDLSGLLPGSHVVTPKVVVPEGIQVEGVLPPAIEVQIEFTATPPAPPPGGQPPPPGETPGAQGSSLPPQGTETPTPAAAPGGTLPPEPTPTP